MKLKPIIKEYERRPQVVKVMQYDGTYNSACDIEKYFKNLDGKRHEPWIPVGKSELYFGFPCTGLSSIEPNSYIVWNDETGCNVYSAHEFKKLYKISSIVKIWYEFEYAAPSEIDVSLHDRLASIMRILNIKDYKMLCTSDQARVAHAKNSSIFILTNNKIEISFCTTNLTNNIYDAVLKHLKYTGCHLLKFEECII